MNDERQPQRGAAGRRIQVGRGDVAFRAFVPNPLPPTYKPTLELMRVLSDADRSLGELAGLGRNMANPQLLIGPFLRREAVLSSRIEGTQADIRDLYIFEAGQRSLPGFQLSPPGDVLEVFNYVRALEYGLQRLEKFPMSLRLIRELHGLLMEGVRGEHATPGQFRRSQNWIGPPGSVLANATFVPPPVAEMEQVLGDFEIYLHGNDANPPLIRLAFIHYQFEAIHPFIDGNGRIGRLLLSLLLVHWNMLPLLLLYLSAYFEKHRQRYYDLLLAVSERGAWDEWLRFFLQGVAEQAKDANHRARELEDLRVAWQNRLHQVRASGLALAVVNFLFQRPVLSATEVREHFDVTYQTAMNTLRRLEAMQILVEVTGQARNQQFMASSILQIIQ